MEYRRIRFAKAIPFRFDYMVWEYVGLYNVQIPNGFQCTELNIKSLQI